MSKHFWLPLRAGEHLPVATAKCVEACTSATSLLIWTHLNPLPASFLAAT